MAVNFSLLGLMALCVFSALVYRPFATDRDISPGYVLDALSTGILAFLLVIAGLLIAKDFSGGNLLTSVLALAAAGVVVGLMRHGKPSLVIGFSYSSAALLFLTLLAIYVRREPTNFVYMTGDMGEYVNMASTLVTRGQLADSFPHLFTGYLAASVAFFGPVATVAHYPLLGVLSGLILVKILADFEVKKPAIFFAMITTAFGLMPVWYSKFPVSETLYGLIVLCVVSSFYLSINRRSFMQALLVGVGVFLLGITRGNGLVFSVMVMVALYASLLFGASRKVIAVMISTTLLGTFFAYVYNIVRLPTYYLDFQLYRMIGSSLTEFGQSIGVFEFGLELVAIFCLCLIASVIPVGLVRFAPNSELQKLVVYCFIVATSGVALFVVGSSAFFSSVPAAGYFACGFAILCLVVSAKEQDPAKLGTITLALLIVISSALLFSVRMDELNNHAYFLYWQRYIFGDFYWGLLILSGIGFSLFIGFLKFDRKGIVGGLILCLVAVESISASRKLWSRALFEDSFTHVTGPLEHFGTGPKYFSGFGPGNTSKPTNWFFQNMWRAYAMPLTNLFGVRFENVNPGRMRPFGKDPRPTLNEIEADMLQKGASEADLLIVNLAGNDSELDLFNKPEGRRGQMTWMELHRDLDYVRLIPAKTDPKQLLFYEMPVESKVYRLTLHRD